MVYLDNLYIGASIKISSINLPENVVPTIQGRDFVVATVAAPSIIKEPEKPTEETPAEGTEGEAAVEGPLYVCDASGYYAHRASTYLMVYDEKGDQLGYDAMEMMSIPMFNAGYADNKGNIFYLYNASLPIRNEKYNCLYS